MAFESSDAGIYVNMNAEVYDGIAPKPKQIKHNKEFNITTTLKRERWVVSWINDNFTNINAPGYTQVLSYSTTLGGYVGAGYISYDNAINVAHSCIKANSYLK